MYNEKYIDYLNTLHNYNAQNANAYGESNIKSPFYKDVMVKVRLSEYICEKLKNDTAQSIILTGHAGDGKTSIMYQVLQEFEKNFPVDEQVFDIELSEGKKLRCIKDFSEINDDSKENELRNALDEVKAGGYAFIVANTGPLINTFGKLFGEDGEKARIELIDAIDDNKGKKRDIMGNSIRVINVASVDNTFFATEFLKNITKETLWSECEKCNKCQYCHIYRNRNLILKNSKRVYEFISMHYVWLAEHGKRLTIRSMTEQLVYMITGGFNCKSVKKIEPYRLLFSNLFFGYIGTEHDDGALMIEAVREANQCGYDRKRMRSDEELLISENYNELFGKDIVDIIKDGERNNAYVNGWSEFLRRTYIMMNIVTNDVKMNDDYEDVFSKQFKHFCDLRDGTSKPTKLDVNLICDALSMIYVGTINNDNMIPLTLSRQSGLTQNVQLITGTVYTRDLQLVQCKVEDDWFNKDKNRYILKIKIGKYELDSEISLPLLDYFEELKNGIVSTNVDPQLSHGIESIKAQISNMERDEEDVFEMVILRNDKNLDVRLELTDTKHIREV